MASARCFAQSATTQCVIDTVAGIPPALAYGGPATAAYLRYPRYLVPGNVGGFYFGEHRGHTIRRVSPDETITVIAGTGASGTAADGQQAVAPAIGSVTGLALDNNGEMYFGDSYGGRVRRISANGILSTVAGSGVTGYSGDGGPATAARGDGGAATSASLNRPHKMAVHARANLYIADQGNNRSPW